MATSFAPLEESARSWLLDQGIASADGELLRSADLRYRNQGWELTVPVPDGALSPDAVARAVQEFHDLHQRLYTYSMPDVPVQLVNLRVTAVGRLPNPKAAEMVESSGDPAAVSRRPVTFQRGQPALDTPVYRREQLRPGVHIEGPAIVQQDDTTSVVWPGFTASIEPHGNMIIRRGGKE